MGPTGWKRLYRAPLLVMSVALLGGAGLSLGQIQSSAGVPGAMKLNIVILEGEGAINNVRQRVAREPVIQVTDENDRPVAGAAVTFLLPGSGPGGTFADGSTVLTTQTDAQGRAVVRGLRANRSVGEYEIRVTVSHQGRTASAAIGQVNAAAAAAAGISAGTLAVIIGVVAGGAIAAGVALTRGDNGAPPVGPPTPQPPTATIGAGGSPSFGPP